MKKIVLEVEDAIGEAYLIASSESKKQIDLVVNNWLKIAISKANDEAFYALLNEIQTEARNNGLTEEILQKILSEHD